MIKVKNSELNETATQSFNELLDMNLPVSTSWQIAKLAKEVDSLIVLRKEAINKMVEKFAVKDKDGKMVEAKDEKGNAVPNSTKIEDPEAYKKAMDKFEALENELNFEPISIKDLEKKNDEIKPLIFFNLSFLFTD